MLSDRVRHRRILTVALRVIASHRALELRKFADHVGYEISLREQRGPIGVRRAGADARRNVPRDEAQSLDAISQRPELVVVHDAGELVDARLQRMLSVLIEKELCVGQPRAQHALIAADDR